MRVSKALQTSCQRLWAQNKQTQQRDTFTWKKAGLKPYISDLHHDKLPREDLRSSNLCMTILKT